MAAEYAFAGVNLNEPVEVMNFVSRHSHRRKG
jgi:hypothetical protein